jgi:transcriptional regulator with XRE-family HTH domain
MTLEEIKAALRQLRDEKTVDEQDEAAAYSIAFNFLSEVETLMDEQGLTRRALAEAVGTSPSYITQLFRGDRVLNLLMAARMQRVLGIQFKVKAMRPLPIAESADTHPVMKSKLPRALRGVFFAENQANSGGQAHIYSTKTVSLTALVDDFS